MLLLVELAVGGLIPIQTAANFRLRLSVGNKPVVSALVSFTVALLVAVLATTALRDNPLPHFADGVSAPRWMWVGGLVGVMFVISGATLAPLLGTATAVIAFNARAIAVGQALEARGAFGARKNPLTAMSSSGSW